MELMEKYKRLSEREQYLTIAFAVVVIVGAFYWLILVTIEYVTGSQ